MGKRRQMSLTDQLRKTIEECGQTRYAIGKATGIDQATLSRFCSGERGLSMEALDALGLYLDLELAPRKSTKKAR